jgi:Icc-related predicted phosphoesterase
MPKRRSRGTPPGASPPDSSAPGPSVCFFVSDLHGHLDRYEKLFHAVLKEGPRAVFLGGDLLPSHLYAMSPALRAFPDFTGDFLAPKFAEMKRAMGRRYPRVFLILGNDDPRSAEPAILAGAGRGLWEYVQNRRSLLSDFPVYGYAYVPPTPFRLKDWERYDVSRYVDPGCIAPEEGAHSVPVPDSESRDATIKADLERLAGRDDLSRAVFLFHSPPYQTNLDRAGLDGQTIDHVPLDVNVGSIAVRRFIETRQPLLTLHGHVHESARITGSWRDRIGRTYAFSAAHDGPELALVRFSPENLDASTRDLV